MKIKKLEIDSYRHLQNVSFDFTYPEGHEKFGQVLEKICFIGQSATGKTSVLEMIKDNVISLNSAQTINDRYLVNLKSSLNGKSEYIYNNMSLIVEGSLVILNDKEYESPDMSGGGTLGRLLPDNLKLLYLSSDVISKQTINVFNTNPLNILNEQQTSKFKNSDSNYIYEFVQDINSEIWLSLLHEILDYRKRFTQMASEIINKGAIADVNRLSKQFSKWSEENKNPLISFANAFNPILKRLNLEVDLINTEYPVPIKSLNKDDVIPISSLSTGTKSLLLSMFPLFELDTSDSIVIIDEPERSLFPDIQIDLISHYKRLAPNAQIIIATHSPFIAAAFEPEERFILHFDEKGEVAVRRGESPIGDDPNDILRNDFNVDYYNDFGKKAYRQYLNLKAKAAQETEPEKKKELIIVLAELGDKYNF